MNFTFGGLPKIPHKQFMIIDYFIKNRRCTQKTTTIQHTCNTYKKNIHKGKTEEHNLGQLVFTCVLTLFKKERQQLFVFKQSE